MGGGSKHLSGTFTTTNYEGNIGFGDGRLQLSFVVGGSCTVPEISSFVSLSSATSGWFSFWPEGVNEGDAAIYRFSCRVDGNICYENVYGFITPTFYLTSVTQYQNITPKISKYAYLTKGKGKDPASVIDVAEIQYPILTFPDWINLVSSSINGSDIYSVFYSDKLYDLGVTTNNMELASTRLHCDYVSLSAGQTYTIEVDYRLDAIVSPTGVRTF